MSLLPYALARPFLFGLDPEAAHDLTLRGLLGMEVLWVQRAHDHGFIGAEPFVNGVAVALAHVRDRRLANVRLWKGDALDVLRRIPDGALSFLYLLHPDPWPKARHNKRRLVQPPFIAELARVLQPPGTYWEYNDVRINQLSLALLHLFGRALPMWVAILLPFEMALILVAGSNRPRLLFYTLLAVLFTPPFMAAFAAPLADMGLLAGPVSYSLVMGVLGGAPARGRLARRRVVARHGRRRPGDRAGHWLP